jgi:hypothetical protein
MKAMLMMATMTHLVMKIQSHKQKMLTTSQLQAQRLHKLYREEQ